MKMGSNIDLILKAPKSRKILWNRKKNIDLSGLGDRSWKQKPKKNRIENGVSLRRPLGIDLCKNLMDFRLQVGTKNRAKTRQDAPERASKTRSIFDAILKRFGMRKCAHLEPMLTAKTTQKSLKSGVRNEVAKMIDKV